MVTKESHEEGNRDVHINERPGPEGLYVHAPPTSREKQKLNEKSPTELRLSSARFCVSQLIHKNTQFHFRGKNVIKTQNKQ